MRMFAGLDVGFKRTAVCVVDEAGRIVWRGVVDTYAEALSRALQHWGGKLAKVGLESGSMTPWARQSGVRTTAAVWYSTAVAAGDQEVRRGGASVLGVGRYDLSRPQDLGLLACDVKSGT